MLLSLSSNRSRTLYRYVDWNQNWEAWRTAKYSRTLYRYVDWNRHIQSIITNIDVVPYIGTWIETRLRALRIRALEVVPYIGTWIETLDSLSLIWYISRRTLYRYVDWNQKSDVELVKGREGRTLYRYVDWNVEELGSFSSHRGRTLYRYVDWNSFTGCRVSTGGVVPYIGTWIETYKEIIEGRFDVVVPYIGTWIETSFRARI